MLFRSDNIIAGSVAGISRVTIGYPLDTIKTYLQSKGIQGLDRSVSGLYRGVSYPLWGSMVINSSLFGIEEYVNKKIDNHWISGSIAGLATSLIISPIELYKIRSQNRLGRSMNPFLGLRSTMLREGIAGPIYFGVFHKLRDHNIHSAVAGGVSGFSSLMATYPLDTVKTRIQSSTHPDALTALRAGNLYKGSGIWGVRAILVNAIGFYTYETCKELLNH